MTEKAVVLLSGGIDSGTTMAIAKAEGYEVYALSFDYAQRHRIELHAARSIAAQVGAEEHLVLSFDLGIIGGSALTSSVEVPKRQESEAGEAPMNSDSRIPDSAIPVTYVPARNTIFLSFALAWAEVLKAPHIFIGANAVDYSGYPDCRPEYLGAFEAMANLATKVAVEGKMRFTVRAPLLFMTKGEIIKKGAGLGFDYALTWSCYDPQPRQGLEVSTGKPEKVEGKRLKADATKTPTEDLLRRYVPCGRCDSCLFRAKGFGEAGIVDPLLIRSR